jgi:outer membrane lipase/esterase
LHSTRALPLGPHKTIKPKERFPMTTRRRWHISVLAAAALIVAGCGGGSTDAPVASRVIAFGDSLSDIGTYTAATQIALGQAAGVPPFLGGKFTTNTHTGYTQTSNTSTSNIWVEWIAARLGVVMTPAEAGFITTRVPCPAQAQGLASTCTGYAQGGARVTNPIGVGKDRGFLTIPVVDQIASHNTRTVPGFTSGFGDDDIVFVWSGHNDAITQIGLVGASATTPQAAVAAMAQAGTELAALIKNEIVAKGAEQVAWMNAVDLSLTPAFASRDAQTRGLMTQLTAAFNDAVVAGLAGTDVRTIDVRGYLASVIATPSIANLTNVTTPVCDPARIAQVTSGQVTNGTSLFCNASPAALFPAPLPSLNTLVSGTNATSYLFADDVHPSTGGHKATADFVWQKLKDFGWVPNNL